MASDATPFRPGCEAEGRPHDRRPLGGGFFLCGDCGLLFAEQPGCDVWLSDVWLCRMAELLHQALYERDRDAAGVAEADVRRLMSAEAGAGLPWADDLVG